MRIGILVGLLSIGLGVVLTGAYNIEVADGAAWRALAEKQRMRRLHVTPKRGTIYDRTGTPLAISVEVPSCLFALSRRAARFTVSPIAV